MSSPSYPNKLDVSQVQRQSDIKCNQFWRLTCYYWHPKHFVCYSYVWGPVRTRCLQLAVLLILLMYFVNRPSPKSVVMAQNGRARGTTWHWWGDWKRLEVNRLSMGCGKKRRHFEAYFYVIQTRVCGKQGTNQTGDIVASLGSNARLEW